MKSNVLLVGMLLGLICGSVESIHSNDGSVHKTDDAANYTETSIYETQIFGDSRQKKKLISVGENSVALPTAGQLVIKYRIDNETSYTTIFTNTTDNSMNHESINIESSGATLPTFREIQIRAESTGGAELTSIYFKYEEIADGLTD